MKQITIHRKMPFKLGLPYWVFINGQPIGIMRQTEVSVLVPENVQLTLGVKLVFQLWRWQFSLDGHCMIPSDNAHQVDVCISDKERWWNLLFDIDLVVWFLLLFVALPTPWDVVYHVLSEGFFALWMLRIIIIRKHYFTLKMQ